MPSPPDDDFQLDIQRLRVRISQRATWLAAVVLALALAGHLLDIW